MIVLGVDPGSVRTGWGALDWQGSRARLLDQGVIAAPARSSLPERLRLIHTGVAALIARLAPDVLAVEEAFHAVNVRTALVLGHVRGVVLLCGASAGLRIREFPPATIKQQVTGSGRADKVQVALMVERHLGLSGAGRAGDAADALAVALCCAHQETPLAALVGGQGGGGGGGVRRRSRGSRRRHSLPAAAEPWGCGGGGAARRSPRGNAADFTSAAEPDWGCGGGGVEADP